jgi:hypothetical protein
MVLKVVAYELLSLDGVADGASLGQVEVLTTSKVRSTLVLARSSLGWLLSI